MGRSPCCEKVGLKKGPWTPEEDQKLLAYIEEHGHGSWRALPAKAGTYLLDYYQYRLVFVNKSKTNCLTLLFFFIIIQDFKDAVRVVD